MPPLIRLLRPHQWVKNGFVAAPLFFTPEAVSSATMVTVALGIAAFCALSSAVYVLNDTADRESDRLHPEKCRRPIASGAVSVATALVVMVVLAAVGFGLGLALPWPFGLVLALYAGMNVAYSFKLKHVAILDVMVIAMGFVLRVEAGAALIAVRPSVWILICTGMLALFIALAKRRDDIVRSLDASHRAALAGYSRQFIDTALTAVLGGLLVSYLIYTTDPVVQSKLGTDQLYLTAPFVIAGVLRYLQIAIVEERSGNPTMLAITDRFLICAVLGWIGMFGVLIYG
ncbi:MAG: decaprenyl-phosphate phosphoribosyltransferase [Alphaproteobacteria bacterium]|nr:decaprenyl-phosphate phosphoribosyltransferase [Alphaproteobacteria bacterium]